MMQSIVKFCVSSGFFILFASSVGLAQHTELPHGNAPPAIFLGHFPDRVHEFVWKNWNTIEPAKLAKVVGANTEDMIQIAESIGLPAYTPAATDFKQRGYSTIIRRNWHLLPYEQLLELLDMAPERLAAILREEDFLFIKLGSVKPKCERLTYRKPDETAQQRADHIRRLVAADFGEEIYQLGEPRFDFVRQLSTPLTSKTSTQSATKSADSLRLVYSYISVFGDPLLNSDPDPYPDGLLQRLSAVGVNGVWLHAVLRDLAPGGPTFPEFGADHQRRLANLRALVERAKRYDIGVYLYFNEPRAMPASFFKNRADMAGVREDPFTAMCTSHPAVRQWMKDALTHVFREVPDLAGIYAITASENLTNCASHGGWRSCEHCQQRRDTEIIADTVAILEEGVHRGNPQAKVIIADWGWKPWGRSSEVGVESTGNPSSDNPQANSGALAIIPQLPRSVMLMSVSEWDVPIERGGIQTAIGEYSMSVAGPGPRALRHWPLAKKAGLKIAAEVQFNNTCEIASLPYIPVMDLVAEHCHNLAPINLDGMLIGWTQGGYPSPNFHLAAQFDQDSVPDVETALDTLAQQRFGPAGASYARKAWTLLSNAYRQYPFHIHVVYNSPVQYGPANLLYPSQTNYKACVWGIPYDHLEGWRGPYPPETFAAQFATMAADWNAGVDHLQMAVDKAPADMRREVEADLRYARAAGIHFQSVANQARFVMARDALSQSHDALSLENRRSLRAEMQRCLESEITLARRLFSLAQADSRIGFEPSCQYFYLPLDLVEKVINCRWLLDQIAIEDRSDLPTVESPK